MPAGGDTVYALQSGGVYQFVANGTDLDLVAGSSQIFSNQFHDTVQFANHILITGSAKIGAPANNGYEIGNEFIMFDNGTNGNIDFYVNGLNEMRLETDGDLHVDKDVIAYSTTIASDLRLKENIQPIGGSLDAICNLEGVIFDWKHRDEKGVVGLIAQNVEEYIPQAIKEKTLPFHSNEDGKKYKTINYDTIVPHLIESIKELKSEIDKLKIKLENR